MFLHRWEDFSILDGTTVENKGKLILIFNCYLTEVFWKVSHSCWYVQVVCQLEFNCYLKEVFWKISHSCWHVLAVEFNCKLKEVLWKASHSILYVQALRRLELRPTLCESILNIVGQLFKNTTSPAEYASIKVNDK